MSNKDGVGIIPTDVPSGILTRLPVKSLGRFKMVSKPWQSLIEDTKFVHSHYRQSQEENETSRQYLMVEVSPYNKEQEGGKAKCYQVDKYDKAVEVKGPAISYRAIAFCEGLVCYLGRDGEVHVVNPITQQAITLPKPQCLRTRGKGTLYQYNRHALGFGFDSVSSKYKVVIVVLDKTRNFSVLLAEMFTLGSKSKSWKKIDSSMLYTRVPLEGKPVYVVEPLIGEVGRTILYHSTLPKRNLGLSLLRETWLNFSAILLIISGGYVKRENSYVFLEW